MIYEGCLYRGEGLKPLGPLPGDWSKNGVTFQFFGSILATWEALGASPQFPEASPRFGSLEVSAKGNKAFCFLFWKKKQKKRLFD
jgi:hypothetical protein